MADAWDQFWKELRDSIQRQPRCPDHPEFPCVHTLREEIPNDIVRIEESGIWVRSHKTNRERKVPATDIHRWWDEAQRKGWVSIDPRDVSRSGNSAVIAAILSQCVPNKIASESGELRLVSDQPEHSKEKDPWGYRLKSGAAAINAVLIEAEHALTEEEIIARIRVQGLKERGAVANHLLSLRHKGFVTKTEAGFLRVGNSSMGGAWLHADDAAESEPSESAIYVPGSIDRRPVLQRQIRARRGQKQYRDSLRRRYGDQCVITGCRVPDVLEAAHINPYREENDNHAENGLLLRADIHTLFDLDLLGIDPTDLRIEIHPSIAAAYGELTGKRLHCNGEKRPSSDALKKKYSQFCKRINQDSHG